MFRSLPEFISSHYAFQHTESREAYKNKLEMAQVFADLERRLKGRKRVADELSAYLFD